MLSGIKSFQFNTNTKTQIILVLVVSVCAFIWAYSNILKYSMDFAHNAGRYLAISMFVWFVANAIFLRGSTSLIKTLGFIVIYSGFLAGSFVGLENYKSNLGDGLSSIKQAFEETIEEGYDKDGYAVEIKKPINTHIESSGDIGVVEKFVKSNISQQVEMQNKYLRRLKDIQWETLFDANRLTNDPELKESKYMLRQAENALSEYETTLALFIEDVEHRVESLKLSPEFKAGFIMEFKKSINESKTDAFKLMGYEREILELTGKMIAFLDSNKGGWSSLDDTIVFETDKQVNEYNSLLTYLELLSAKQSNLQLQIMNNKRKAFDKADKFLK